MGSIQFEDSHHGELQKHAPSDIFSSGVADDDGFLCYKVAGLASDEANAPTGMREEILLLAWLLVLMRTRESGQISFEWAYQSPANGFEHELPKWRLSVDEVVTELQSHVVQCAEAIGRHVTVLTTTSKDTVANDPVVSLILSTGLLSQIAEAETSQALLQLETRFDGGRLKIRPAWCAKGVLPYTVTHHVEALVETVRMCISDPNASIESFTRPTAYDLEQIWTWNHSLPPLYSFCMHDLISEKSQSCPDKEGIVSWDGSLTYGQIEQFSTQVAVSLSEMGVELHDIVPVCFEKSRWTIVALLAVMKAGGTFVLMDPTLPASRLQNMASQVSAKLMVASRKQHELSTQIIPEGRVLVVEENTLRPSLSLQPARTLAKVPPSALMYIIFTSGSTGAPKGVMISHETYSSSAIPRAEAVGYTEDSRVLDFASYAFDVSIDSMLCTLVKGGCLCIPSDEDRLNDLNGVTRRMRVNYAGLTPSVARILDQDVIASMSALGLGGEATTARDVNRWGQDTRIVIGYGPSECTIGCTVNSSAATGRDYISIGPGNGAAIWITDPSDHESLVPIGAVGELLVEGPIVGQGYLNDAVKTSASFIEAPSWLRSGHGRHVGRHGRLYKTGDLGKYDPDGSGGIVFVGRKDTQVKLRGQRVELGEIEYQLKTRLPPDANVIAEVISPAGSGGQPTLVAFVTMQAVRGHEQVELTLVQPPEELELMLSRASTELAEVLPRYMLPAAYIPVNYIPVLISGKIDRKQLRQFGAGLDLRQLDQNNPDSAAGQLSDLERRLRHAWSQTLKVDEETIKTNDNFFALGGDSLIAMRLVSAARSASLDLTVANIFRCPTLSAMAKVVNAVDPQQHLETAAFSMVTQTVESACLEAARVCGVEPASVEDIYPCTPSQESLFTFSHRSARAYIAQRVACIPSNISLEALKRAWEDVYAAIPILRTHLVQGQEQGLQQVVLRKSIDWRYSTDLQHYLDTDRAEQMEFGDSLARYCIVDQSSDGKRYMVWTVHHVLYDGWSEPIILQRVGHALEAQQVETQAVQMRDFVKYVRSVSEEALQDFWRAELAGAVGPQFPRLPSRDYLPNADGFLERQIHFEPTSRLPFTMATLIRGAWSLVAAQYTGSDDVVFGETFTGRDIPVAGVEGIEGPLIATIPVRVRVDRAITVESYLQAVQHGVQKRSPFQHFGMQNIRKVSRDAQHACEAGTGLVIQPAPDYVGSELGFDQGDVVREALHFNPYSLMLACGTEKDGFRVCASFDRGLIEYKQMERILAQLETACVQLSKDLSRKVGEISCLPDTELCHIWQWNQTPPLSMDESSRTLRADPGLKQGSIYPPAVVPWVCDPRNPSLLSPIGCVGELWLEGPFVTEQVTDSPSWLVAGSSAHSGRRGRVQATGDMVQAQENGTLIYVGRKEDFLPVQGHAVNIAELETHFSKNLPPSIRAAATVLRPSSEDGKQSLEQELIAFVEQQPSDHDDVELMAETPPLTCTTSGTPGFETTPCSTIPLSLAEALRKLDKFVQDSLPPYMVPTAYVVVEQLPMVKEQIDHQQLHLMASSIRRTILTQLQEGLKKAWTTSFEKANLTPTEAVLRSAWAEILRMAPERIDLDDNFFRLGGDSVLAMKMVSSLRLQGHSLTVADIFQHMRLRDAAKVLKLGQAATTKSSATVPFSTLGRSDVDHFLSDIVKPQLADSDWSIQDVLPVTDSQALDIRATVRHPRTSLQYNMLYLSRDIDQTRLVNACNELVRIHDILRTVFVEHESSFFQVVLDSLTVESSVKVYQTDKELEPYAMELCNEDAASEYALGSPFLRIFLVQDENGEQCLVIGLSHAQYDGISLPILLRDLEVLYTGEKVTDVVPFSSYITRICDASVAADAITYWRGLLDGSRMSILNGLSVQPTDKAVFLVKPVDVSQRPQEITTANLFVAAWALALARRLKVQDVIFGNVTSGRQIDLAHAEQVMGPCYQFTPVRVSFAPGWTAMELLLAVQGQGAESAAYDFLGFDKISKECTSWSSEGTRFFNSIVHHQDFEDFDTMPFAGGVCRVEILNPHGDAVQPLKVVSFVRAGQRQVGILGSETDIALIQEILNEVAGAVHDLTIRHEGDVVLESWEPGHIEAGEKTSKTGE